MALIGYSGGAIASNGLPRLAPTYAPDVNKNLVGAAIGGVLVHPNHNLDYVQGALCGAALPHGFDWRGPLVWHRPATVPV